MISQKYQYEKELEEVRKLDSKELMEELWSARNLLLGVFRPDEDLRRDELFELFLVRLKALESEAITRGLDRQKLAVATIR